MAKKQNDDHPNNNSSINWCMNLDFGTKASDYSCALIATEFKDSHRESHIVYQGNIQNQNKVTLNEFINEVLSLGIFGKIEEIDLPFPFSIDSLSVLWVQDFTTQIKAQISGKKQELLAVATVDFNKEGLAAQIELKSKFYLTGIPLADQVFRKEDGISDIRIRFDNQTAAETSFGASFLLEIGQEKRVLSFGTLNEKKASSPVLPYKEKEPESKPEETKNEIKTVTIKPKAEESWKEIRKKIGPVSIERIGISVQMPKNGDSELKILLCFDASLSFSIIELKMMGLRLSIPLSTLTDLSLEGLRKLEFAMDGLGLAFEKGDLSINGGFLKQGNTYSGILSVRYKTFQLSAIGEYTRLGSGKHSMSAFCLVKYPLGGPPVFYVTGLAAGFGLNRRLKVPEIDKIKSFPLIQMACEPSGQKGQPKLMDVLRNLHDYIEEAENQYFIAVGVEFTTCNLAKTFALAMVSFGTELEVYLLGISTLSLPAGSSSPMIHIELAIKAAFLPKQGKLTFEGKLTEESYLFSRDCKVSGGFAMYMWFGDNPYAGDFVITVGGYHPLFQVPKHYPTVERVGIRWAITQHLLLEGSAYFALTPNGIMAGGRLSLVYTQGNLKAWFIASADFLLEWAPFHYDVNVSISVGVSYTLKIWKFQHTFKIELGAGLHLFGPDFAGEVNISWAIISFTIKFGDRNNAGPKLSWMEFRSKFLNDPLSFNVCAGLIDTEENDKEKRSIVNGYETAFNLQSKIPVTELAFGNKVIYQEKRNLCGVLPMGEDRQLSNHMQIRLKRKLGGNWEDIEINDYFEVSFRKEKLAPALWGLKKPSPYKVSLDKENVTTVFFKEKEQQDPNKGLQFYNEEVLSANEKHPWTVNADVSIPNKCIDYLEENLDTYQQKCAEKKPIERVIREMDQERRQAAEYLHSIYEDLLSGESLCDEQLYGQEQDGFVIPPIVRTYQ